MRSARARALIQPLEEFILHSHVARPIDTRNLLGMQVAAITGDALLEHLFGELEAGRGGWLLTANVDILRRFVRSPRHKALYAQADISVADGMPLVWAARLSGNPLPQRLSGSGLVPRIAAEAASRKRSLYLLGGEPGAGEGCRTVLQRRHPSLVVCGQSSPWLASPPTQAELQDIAAVLREARPDVLLVAMGSPKQEQVIAALRQELPSTWMAGVGISFSFIAGLVPRAPPWMQRAGLEWLHRMAQEPRRLARRYLVDDLPFVVRLLAASLLKRRSSGG